jgi:nucleoside-diphosphate-sugar epimerase
LRILVTGASGFIGRWAVKSLVDRGAQVHALSLRSHAWIPQVVAHAGNLLDPRYVRQLVEETRPDTILHAAWNVEHGKFWTAPESIDWAGATLTLARAALDLGVRRFVGVGTCFEYRWPDDANCDELGTAIDPTTLYAVAKDASRRVVEALDGLSFAWARLFYLYGPFEHERRLVASLARSLARNEPALLTQGLAIRDFLDVRDAGDALAALVLSNVCGPVNIASGTGESIASIADRLGRISGRSHLLRPGALPDRTDEPPRIVAEVKRLKSEVGFEPTRSLERGLADAYSWWCARTSTPQ